MELEDHLSDLEEEIGPIESASEWNPGVYHIEVDRGGVFMKEYFAVLDDAPMAAKVKNYGKKMDGLRLFALDDNTSGWRIVQYEISKYRAMHISGYWPSCYEIPPGIFWHVPRSLSHALLLHSAASALCQRHLLVGNQQVQ